MHSNFGKQVFLRLFLTKFIYLFVGMCRVPRIGKDRWKAMAETARA